MYTLVYTTTLVTLLHLLWPQLASHVSSEKEKPERRGPATDWSYLSSEWKWDTEKRRMFNRGNKKGKAGESGSKLKRTHMRTQKGISYIIK